MAPRTHAPRQGAPSRWSTARARPLRSLLQRLYEGNDRTSIAFLWFLLAVDVATIALFVEMTFVHETRGVAAVELALGVVILLDVAARAYIDPRPGRFLVRPATLADLVVVVSMVGALFAENLGFLRVLRALRLFRSYHVLGLMRRRSRWIRCNEEVILATLNLTVFLFTTASLVFVTQAPINPDIHDYLDALYFTVTTLSTTGFGDITLVGDWGQVLSIMVMILGLSLFLRLLQTVFRPSKVNVTCRHCGLNRHEPDAVHCKHCGAIVHIPTEGF